MKNQETSKQVEYTAALIEELTSICTERAAAQHHVPDGLTDADTFKVTVLAALTIAARMVVIAGLEANFPMMCQHVMRATQLELAMRDGNVH